MTAPSLSELTAQISFAVESVDVRYRTGELGPADIDDLKRTIDEARLRLWGLLNTASGPEGRVFEERMRIRRARGICARGCGGRPWGGRGAARETAGRQGRCPKRSLRRPPGPGSPQGEPGARPSGSAETATPTKLLCAPRERNSYSGVTVNSLRTM